MTREVRIGIVVAWLGAGLLIARFVGGLVIPGILREGLSALGVLPLIAVFLGVALTPYLVLRVMLRAVKVRPGFPQRLFLITALGVTGTTVWLIYLIEFGSMMSMGYIIYPLLQFVAVVGVLAVAVSWPPAQQHE